MASSSGLELVRDWGPDGDPNDDDTAADDDVATLLSMVAKDSSRASEMACFLVKLLEPVEVWKVTEGKCENNETIFFFCFDLSSSG